MNKKYITPIVLILLPLAAFGTLAVLTLSTNQNTTGSNIQRFGSCFELSQAVFGQNFYGRPQPAPLAPRDSDVSQSEGGVPNLNPNFSQTNVQVAGIDEADVVKVDQNYIYAIRNEKIYVFDVKTNPVKEVTQITPNINPTSLYLTEDKLVVLGTSFYNKVSLNSQTSDSAVNLVAPDSQVRDSIWPAPAENTFVYTYDKSDWALKSALALNAQLQSSRLFEDKIYLAFNKNNWNYFYRANAESLESEVEQLLPKFSVDTSGKELESAASSLIECSDVANLSQNATSFAGVLEFDLNSSAIKSEVGLGNVNNVYMSQDNLYLFSNEYKEVPSINPTICDPLSVTLGGCPLPPSTFETTTGIYKIDLENIRFSAKAEAKGSLLNQYSADERNETLRIVTTTQDSQNWQTGSAAALYIFDNNLQQLGTLENLAPSERVYSSRFLENRLYLVTFRQIDPLFVIDLADAKNPKVLGELKVTGYSDYLHNFGQNKLLGFGREVDARTGRVQELKLSAFDATDPVSPKEIAKYNFETGLDSEVLHNPKALYIELNRNRFAIPTYKYNPNGSMEYGFSVFNYDGESLNLVENISNESSTNALGYYVSNSVRVVRFGDNLISIGQGEINIYDEQSIQLQSSLNFD